MKKLPPEEEAKLGFETRAIHAGQRPDPTTGAVMTPVYLTSTYVQDGPGVHKGFEYSRTRNPTRDALEGCLASLEGAKYGLAFASGLAATDCVMHTLDAGDHVVHSDDVYGGTFRIFDKVFKRQGLRFTAVDMTDPANVEKAIRPETKFVWIETPTNPTLKLADLAAIAKIAKAKGVRTVVDNTFATPFFQRPLEHGIDVVVHSTTKYLNGHSDVVGGAVLTSDEGLHERLRFHQNAVGGVPGPLDWFLVLRGMKTLPIRMERHAANAAKVVAYLAGHPKVERVSWPGLASHPQHALAKRQMRGFGGHADVRAEGRAPRGADLPRARPPLRLRRVARRRREPDRAPGDHDARERPGRDAAGARHRRRLHPRLVRDRVGRGPPRRPRAGAQGRAVSAAPVPPAPGRLPETPVPVDRGSPTPPGQVTLTRIVMPGQTNARGTLFGGVALSLMDEASAIVALRHARSSVVTAHIDSVDFKGPIFEGEAVEVTARLKMVGRTSMRISVESWGENLHTGERRFCTSAEFVFVAMGADGKPSQVPPLSGAVTPPGGTPA